MTLSAATIGRRSNGAPRCTDYDSRSIPLKDPYTYRNRLKSIPKLVIMATGDEFFTPDDSYAWFDGMKENTWLRLLPNSEHGMSLHSLSSQNIRQGFMIYQFVNG